MTGVSRCLYEHDSLLYLKVNLVTSNNYAFYKVLENYDE